MPHVAMFTRTENATPDETRTFASTLSTMPDVIRLHAHGEDLGLGPAAADYFLVADDDTVQQNRPHSGYPYQFEFHERSARSIIASIARVQQGVTP